MEKKYFFIGGQQSDAWYGLISSSLDRLYLVSPKYRIVKLLQLCFMRDELFYIVDLGRLNDNIVIDNSNCLDHTLTNARRLHLELDVEIKKLKYSELIKKIDPPSSNDKEIQYKMFFCYLMLEQLEEGYQKYCNMLNDSWRQETQGLEITKNFIESVFDDQDFLKIIDRDMQEISFADIDLTEFRKKILKILAFVDYDQPLADIKLEIQKKIERIDFGRQEKELKEIRSQCKINDMNLCEIFIKNNNYRMAQQILKEKLRTVLLLLLK
jgi:hypothetical protein